MTKAKYNKGFRWRAVLRVVGEDRMHGTINEDATLTVRNLLERIAFRIANEEKDRVINIVEALYGRMSHGV